MTGLAWMIFVVAALLEVGGMPSFEEASTVFTPRP
jgi:hypothetical protein